MTSKSSVGCMMMHPVREVALQSSENKSASVEELPTKTSPQAAWPVSSFTSSSCRSPVKDSCTDGPENETNKCWKCDYLKIVAWFFPEISWDISFLRSNHIVTTNMRQSRWIFDHCPRSHRILGCTPNQNQCTYASSRRGVSPQVGPLGGNINLKCTVLKFKIMTLPGMGSGSTLDGDLVNPTFLVNRKILKEANG